MHSSQQVVILSWDVLLRANLTVQLSHLKVWTALGGLWLLPHAISR